MQDQSSPSHPIPLVAALQQGLTAAQGAFGHVNRHVSGVQMKLKSKLRDILTEERTKPKLLGSRRITLDPRLAAAIPGDSVVELVLVNGFNNFLSLYNGALIIRLILTWFPNPPMAVVGPLSTVCDPYLNLFRGIIPPLGAIDFSPILAFVLLSFVTNAAAALPADMPHDKKEGYIKQAQFRAMNPTRGDILWRKRVLSQQERRRRKQQQAEEAEE